MIAMLDTEEARAARREDNRARKDRWRAAYPALPPRVVYALVRAGREPEEARGWRDEAAIPAVRHIGPTSRRLILRAVRGERPVPCSSARYEDEAFALVAGRRKVQDRKWGTDRNLHPMLWRLVIGEEAGEVDKAVLDGDRAGYLHELIDVAASALAAIQDCLWQRAMAGRLPPPQVEPSRWAQGAAIPPPSGHGTSVCVCGHTLGCLCGKCAACQPPEPEEREDDCAGCGRKRPVRARRIFDADTEREEVYPYCAECRADLDAREL